MSEEPRHSDSICIEIANLSVGLEFSDKSIGETLYSRYKGYLSLQPAETVVELVNIPIEADISNKQTASGFPEIRFEGSRAWLVGAEIEGYFDLQAARGRLACGGRRRIETIDYYLRVVYAHLAYRAGGLLFHGAGIERAGRAYLFFGPSGSGKTTVARAGAGFRVLNDDLLLLLPDRDTWLAYSTPFWNPSQAKPEPASAPLAALFWLVKDRKVQLIPMGRARAIGQLVSCVPVLTRQPAFLPELMQRCGEITRVLPVYALHFLPDDQFWREIELAGLVAAG